MRSERGTGESGVGAGVREPDGIGLGVGKRSLTQGLEGPTGVGEGDRIEEIKNMKRSPVVDLIDSTVETVNDAVSGALANEGKPFVTHKTADKAPGGISARTKVGVGEMVTFHSNMPGKWTASNSSPAFPKKATGDEFIWVAMSTKGTAKITFDSGKKGETPTEITMEVVEPTIDYLNPKKATFPLDSPGNCGVNMETDITFGPMDVSFANCMWWEQPGPGTSPTGWFKDVFLKQPGHRLPYHNPNPDDLPHLNMNRFGVDSAGWWDFNGPFTPSGGSFEWVIPTFYRVVDDASRHKIKDVHQKCTIAANGTMTVEKGSATLSRPITG
jgi:hypothetical protein